MHLLAEERELLKSITVYIVPRVSVDGAEYCVTTGGRVRSRKWDAAGEFRSPNTVYPDDINGDGWVVDMRIEHPSGTFVADAKEPRLLVPRQVDSPPPYYKVLPEGLIHDWDGSDDIRSAGTSDIDGGLQGDKNPRTWDGVDFNRQWVTNWFVPKRFFFFTQKNQIPQRKGLSRDEGQNGSGDFPFSELEMRHLITFIHSHPKIFGIMGCKISWPSILLRRAFRQPEKVAPSQTTRESTACFGWGRSPPPTPQSTSPTTQRSSGSSRHLRSSSPRSATAARRWGYRALRLPSSTPTTCATQATTATASTRSTIVRVLHMCCLFLILRGWFCAASRLTGQVSMFAARPWGSRLRGGAGHR